MEIEFDNETTRKNNQLVFTDEMEKLSPLELFKDFYLVLNASNKENINFYLKNGFKLINKDTKYLTFKRNNLKP